MDGFGVAGEDEKGSARELSARVDMKVRIWIGFTDIVDVEMLVEMVKMLKAFLRGILQRLKLELRRR